VDFFPKQKIAFFHIPKTAGRSITEFMKYRFGNSKIITKTGERHEPLGDKLLILEKKYGVNFNDIDIITSIRNPYDLAVSLYHWVWRHRDDFGYFVKKPHALNALNLTFEEWVCNWFPIYHKNYRDFLSVDGQVPLKRLHIIKFESLSDDLQIAFSSLKTPMPNVSLLHLNKTSHLPYWVYFNKKMYRAVNQSYKWCFKKGLYRPIK